MLSPIIRTKSNANDPRSVAISLAVSNCGLRPVPLSPMNAKRTDLSLRGSFNSVVGDACSAASASKIASRLMRSRDHARDEIHDQVRAHIAKDEVAPHDAVLHFRRKGRKVQQ